MAQDESLVPQASPAANEVNGIKRESRHVVAEAASNEIFLALVGPVGAGCSRVADAMHAALATKYADMGATDFRCLKVKVSDLIRDWATRQSLPVPTSGQQKSLDHQEEMQGLGDKMREKDHAAVAVAIVNKIKELRAAEQHQASPLAGDVVPPDGKPRVYVIDSLKNPAEAELLRLVYRDAFALIAVVCEPQVREQRVKQHYFLKSEWNKPETIDAVRKFIKRDGKDENLSSGQGQRVTDTFHLADFFLENSGDNDDDLPLIVNEQVGRLVDLITRNRIVRPTLDETAMHAASSAQRRSACLSRQVGASLVDAHGDIVATGSNEVPRPGGGTYAAPSRGGGTVSDHRCAFSPEWRGCRSTRQQWTIIDSLIEEFPELKAGGQRTRERLKETEIGDLIEFSRAVHAEMDALLSAARSARSPVGGRLFVTTFPCHYCARHIVAAGVHEVQYIEPYPKSLAFDLHKDAIEQRFRGWKRPVSAHEQRDSDIAAAQEVALDLIGFENKQEKKKPARAAEGKVLFRPFVGVAPRLYARVFMQDGKNKDEATGDIRIASPKWGGPWALSRLSYADLEQAVTKAEH